MKEDHIEPGSWQAWVLAARPKTLAGAAVPVMVGLALAWHVLVEGGFRGTSATGAVAVSVLCLLFAFVMQIDANFVNDYFDFMKGNDDESRLGPKRACAMGWIHASQMRRAIVGTTVLACLLGLPLLCYGGAELLWVGVLCVAACFLYTTHLSYWGLGDLLVIIFFGLIPVCVPYYIITRAMTAEVVVGSLACGLVIDTLLMVNNYRDIDNDTKAGKRTLAVRLGKARSRRTYLLLGLMAFLAGLVYALSGHVWAWVLSVGYVVLHVQTYRRMVAIDHGTKLNKVLGMTARNMFVYGLLVAIGVLVS